ncbi:MAG TPA: adenylate/guanylate cyclase domain-containing protein, partial [Helicobacteraceae bacterium]|nr:adenylate/guanylate cyclase domain-containing protein [Helicobacteraceae bacterium]
MSTALGSKHLKKDSRLHHSLKQEIGKRQKNVTIVFTDIIDSTHYWHHHGDVQGRLMVDRLNRILFLMVKRFNGRVVKTIGDSVMALFYRNTDALDASIAIQQALSKLRHEESDFVMRVRIGMHSGEAIVEENDVF